MDSSSLNQYEERLYSVFKTFDVDNEEALNKTAVLALCDALQLEQRGAALVDTLFERRDQRVTFAQFRSGLLAVLGEPAATRAASPPPASDDDSSGREVAPKFVFGSKRYGRRSRPPRAGSAPAPSPATVSAATPAPTPTDIAAPPDLQLDHNSRVDCESALQLCRRLRMDRIDRRLIESIFESVPAAETTVGDFFDRLNSSLTTSIHDAVASDGGGSDAVTAFDGDEEMALPTELVVEAWQSAGVQRPRRLLAELGFDNASLPPADLDRALHDELAALVEPTDARALLLLAALALTRLRYERSRRCAAAVAAERDRLRSDLDEANRRAGILAQEVDENHARLEAELTADLRRAEARHADRLRRAEQERSADRERAAAERAQLEADLARRTDNEQRLRQENDALRERCAEAEARAASADERCAAGERERARLAADLRAAGDRAGGEAGAGAVAAQALAACVDELRVDNARLRDRCDELVAALEARARVPASPPVPHTWHDEATSGTLIKESPPVSLEATLAPISAYMASTETMVAATPPDVSPATPPDVSPATPPPVSPATHCDTSEVAALRAQLIESEERHREEKSRHDDLIKEMESSLELMRVEYERCEEYWSGKLQEERALLAEEQRASDERLGELVAKIADYERQYSAASRLPAIAEAPALERQAAELDRAAAELQRRHDLLRRRDAEQQRRDAELQRRHDGLQRRERELARLAATLGAGAAAGAAGAGAAGAAAAGLRARLARAEAGAARLAARLAAADLLVKDLYVENCLLGPAPRRL